MKILYFTSRFPYPLEKGDKLRAFYQIRELSAYHEIFLVSICDDDLEKKDLEALRPFTKEIYVLRITPFKRFLSLLSAITSGLPFQIAWFYNKSIKYEINKIASSINPDHCVCQLTRMSEYVRVLPFPKTLDYMDSFGIGMKKRINAAKGLSKYLYKIEAARMISYEEKIASQFDHLIIISEQDKNNFSFSESREIKVIGNGIDAYFFEKLNIPKEFDLVFVGNMGYLPNIEAAEYLVEKIIPNCPSGTSLLIAGSNPSKRVLALASEKITVSGWVDDIRESYCKASICIAPIWSGTGQQNKILESMALGIPTITTTSVNNAIGAIPEHEIMIADTEKQFVRAIEILKTNQNIYDQISQNAKQFVKQKFDWKQNGLVLSSIFAQNQ